VYKKRWRVPILMQSSRSDCALVCLAMIVGFYDRSADLAALRRHFSGFNQGITLKDLAGFAESIGYLSRGLRTEPESLSKLRLPVILHWRLDHFVVLVQIRKQGCVIHDPALGRMLCRWSEVDEKFTGVALEIWPDVARVTAPGLAPSRPHSLVKLWDLSQNSVAHVVWIVVLSLVVQLMVLAAPWHVQWTVDRAVIPGDQHLVGVLCLGFGLLLSCRVLAQQCCGLLIVHLGHALSFRFAHRLLSHLVRLPLGWFESRQLGDITSRFSSLQPLREFLTHGAAAIVVDSFMVLVSLLMLMLYNPSIAFLVGGVQFSILIVYVFLAAKLRRLNLELVAAEADEQTHLAQTLQSMSSVKLYRLESNRIERWQLLNTRTLSRSLTAQKLKLGLSSAADLVSGLELLVVIYWLAHHALSGAFSLGMLFAFLTYRSLFAERLRGLSEHVVNLRVVHMHFERVADVLAEAPEAGEALLVMPGNGHHDLVLENVSFRYHTTQPWLLQSLNLQVLPGELVVVIGASGCGKSTLLKLCMGLLEPNDGCVRRNGQTLQGQRAVVLRHGSCAVLQGDGLFSGSLLDNITLFSDPDMNRLMECLGRLKLTELVDQLPMGLHTRVGDLVPNFSSGQLQRILLVRAIYQQPSHLFLDEATANLDLDSAAAVHHAILGLQCTRLVITHDLKFAECADRSFVMEDGRLRRWR